MGLFKDMKNMKKAAKDYQDTTGYERPSMKDAMQQGTDMMNQMTELQQKAARLHAEGVPGTATIKAVRDPQQQVNQQPVLEIDLEISGASINPVPQTVSQPIPNHMVPQFQPGAEVPVLVDRSDATQWVFNWGA